MREWLIGTAALVCLLLLSAARADDPPKTSTPPPPPAAAPIIRVIAELSDGVKIIGQPIGLDALPVKTDFGSVTIPLRLLATVEWTKDRAAAQCRFKNSDLLTTSLEVDTLRLRTSYGEATIPLARINKLTLSEVKP